MPDSPARARTLQLAMSEGHVFLFDMSAGAAIPMAIAGSGKAHHASAQGWVTPAVVQYPLLRM